MTETVRGNISTSGTNGFNSYAKRVDRLVSVIQLLSATRDLQTIMTLVRSAAREIAQSDGATFVLKENDFCFYADEDAISALWKGQRFPMQSCISGWAMMNKKAVIIEDIYQDARIPLEVYKPTFVKSLAMIPIRREDPIGAIGIYWAEHHKCTDQELDLIQALADSVSVAMENVNLFNSLSAKVAELQKVNEAKDLFLMTVSHELRTPLNSILGWTEIMKDPSATPEDIRRGLEVIDRNARTQAHIVEDLLDSSRIITGRLSMDKGEVDLVEVAKQTMALVATEARKKKIELHFAAKVQKALVLGDSFRLQQVLTNLLINAIKFSNDGGEILVSVDKRGPGAVIQVIDHGVGLSQESQSHLFTRFFQADSTTTRKHGGLGLGLSISKYLVEKHNGQINIISEGEGKGTTAEVVIPLIEQNEHSDEDSREHAKANPQKPLQGIHVLAVDDDPDCLQLVEAVLRKSGAEVETASSVDEAIRISRLFHFDALVSDLSMPLEDGFSLVQKVRAGETPMGKEIPAIAVTAFNDKDNHDKALSAGFDEFFGKPFSSVRLINTLEAGSHRVAH
ncbi:hybrid sensor histidine kinase/response regulator [Bdellovibrio sp. ZAP7]|uniref:hybrid sensor histidine kinase/response regulator n=1 Tax=Bdellovibrio sp. ZAP7 TaxID=2231053 RepID=UPI0011587B33|nr:ATP-binding protein [Bdellovibrio sp. ZAP7]QDK46711.1 hybrid sensor histidine kinase/response regulator [Bdellovibrio sp. ZAP7]